MLCVRARGGAGRRGRRGQGSTRDTTDNGNQSKKKLMQLVSLKGAERQPAAAKNTTHRDEGRAYLNLGSPKEIMHTGTRVRRGVNNSGAMMVVDRRHG